MRWFCCHACEAKEKEIQYLRTLIDRLLDKAGVIDKKNLPPPEEISETVDEISSLKKSGAFVYGD